MRLIWAISENGLRGFQAPCEMFPVLRTNVTVNASVCRGLSGHSSLEKKKKPDILLRPLSHLSIHPLHLRAEQEETSRDNGISTCTSIYTVCELLLLIFQCVYLSFCTLSLLSLQSTSVSLAKKNVTPMSAN